MWQKIVKWSTYINASLVIFASGLGAFHEKTYAKEAISWAKQAEGQDVVNLIFAVPILIIAGHLASKGSIRALMIWLGNMIYIIYSYFIYAGFTHFNVLFPLYLLILSFSFYSFIAVLTTLDKKDILNAFSENTPIRTVSIFLFLVATMFAFLELSEIFKNIFDRTIPQYITDSGLINSPVYLLDVAIIMPGIFITGLLLKKKKYLGYLFAAPMISFNIIMGLAVGGMLISLATYKPLVVFGAVITASMIVLARLLREVR